MIDLSPDLAPNLRRLERYRPLVDDWEAFSRALSRPLPVCVWANPLRGEAPALETRLRRAGMEPTGLAWHPGAFRLGRPQGVGSSLEYVAGLLHIQEEVSLLPPWLLAPQPGERVLDLCAAPGGKTAQLAVALGNRGTVVANERYVERMSPLRSNLDRLGVENVSTTTWDAGSYPRGAGLFHRVLVDVPCTCEGTSRKNPEVLERPNPPGLYSRGQRTILRRGVQLCHPGGRVIYSTCTYAPEENEEVVDAVLRDLGDDAVRLVPVELPGLISLPGVTSWQGRRLHPSLALSHRLLPHHNDTGGFFVAVLERLGEAPKDLAEDPPAAEHLLAVDAGEWLRTLEERFALPPSFFADKVFLRTGRRKVFVAASDHRPPTAPKPSSVGLPALHLGMQLPKLATPAAMTYGPAAARGKLVLSAEQAEDYLARRPVSISPGAIGGAGRGLVLVGVEDLVLGMGVLRLSADGAGVLESLFPKGWARGESE